MTGLLSINKHRVGYFSEGIKKNKVKALNPQPSGFHNTLSACECRYLLSSAEM